MAGTIQIECPPMPVLNSGWGIRTDRYAQELPCTGEIKIDGLLLKLVDFRFPKTRVVFIRPGRWLVEPCVAFGLTSLGEGIRISYPAEPVVRVGWNMEAQAIDNIESESFVRVNGVRYTVKAGLPKATGTPDFPFGWFSFTVEKVTIDGKIL